MNKTLPSSDSGIKRKASTVDAKEFAFLVQRPELAYFKNSEGEHYPPTDSQLALLEKLQIDSASVVGKEHASALIDLLISRRERRLATPSQLTYFRRCQYPYLELVTFAEADGFIKGLRYRYP